MSKPCIIQPFWQASHIHISPIPRVLQPIRTQVAYAKQPFSALSALGRFERGREKESRETHCYIYTFFLHGGKTPSHHTPPMNPHKLSPSSSSSSRAQTNFPGIPVDEQQERGQREPHHLESFPQPGVPAQEILHQRLQQHPYHSSNRRILQPAREDLVSLASTGATPASSSSREASMASAVPKHLNFITGNKNKLAEVRAWLFFFSFLCFFTRVRRVPRTGAAEACICG